VRLSFRTKLIAIVGTAAAALLVLIVASAAISQRTEQELAKIQERHLPRLQLGPQLQADFERLKRGLQDAVAARDSDAIAATRAIETKFLVDLDGGGSAVTPGQIAALRGAMDDYYGAAVDVSRRLVAGETGERLVDAMTAMQAKQARAADLLDTVTAFNPNDLAVAFASARRAEITGGQIRLTISLVCLLGLVLLSWWIGRGVVHSLAEVSVGLRRFGGGTFDRPIPISRGDDELADLAQQANQMAESLKRLALERDQNDWVREAVAGLAQETRGELEPAELATRAVRFLARHLEAPAGALYYREGENDLVLLGQHGRVADGAAAPSFRLGEGLVGQAALGEEIAVVKDLPADYLRIRSGLGEAAPKLIVLVPLRELGQARGVLELAFFSPWSARAAEAVSLVRESLVIALEVALARVATRRLLAETQRQAARLHQQDEELRATNEELETQQEELRQTNNELTEQATELEAQRAALEQNNRELGAARHGLEQKAAELSTVSAYKSQFLANMSHELRTPLNSMLLLSNLLGENEDRNLTEKQVEFAQTIHTAGKDLLVLINQVLDLAKIEAGKREVNVAPVPVRQLGEHARLIFSPQAHDKGLRLVVEVASDVPEILQTDGQRIEQILRNLLGNAIKFTSRGEVALRVTRAPADARFRRLDLRRETALLFAVSDTGLGIAPENQERIFVPFEQVDGAIDRKYGGTGLGLSISRELASLLGGELQVESTLGTGSTFRLFLPPTLRVVSGASPPTPPLPDPSELPASGPPALRAPGLPSPEEPTSAPAPTTAAPQAAAERSGGSELLLVIEDDRGFAEAFADVVRKQGLECLVASDGQSGLRLAREHRPMGIVLDVRLPDTDGWRVMEELRFDQATAKIPVHFVSAVNGAERGMALGAVGYLTKPATRTDIVRVIESLSTRVAEGAGRVLVVEDDLVMADSVAKQLAEEKLEVRRAVNAAEALAALEREQIGCIVLDLSLPDMDGLDLLEKLRAEYGANMPSVLIYTARALSKAEARALEAHSEAVVLKDGSSGERLVEEVRLFTRRLKEGLGPRRENAPRPHLGSLNLTGKKILIVDDDMRTVYALSATLRAKGAEVVVAENGKAALDLLDQRPDMEAVLMDIMMPEMDGFEATRRIRQDARFQALPIIALTAKVMKGDAEKCLQAGATEYLPKPIDGDRLLALLSGLLTERSGHGA
jgi:CheY-like chemotaxis protein/signal transduction histidine kinase